MYLFDNVIVFFIVPYSLKEKKKRKWNKRKMDLINQQLLYKCSYSYTIKLLIYKNINYWINVIM